MTAPIRIQRMRAKGWRLPPNTICVTRPGPHGNPFDLNVIDHAVACGLVSHGEPADFDAKEIIGSDSWCQALAETAVLLFRRYVELMPDKVRKAWLAPLRGSDLACWCRLDMPCHADVLLEFSNR